MFNMHQGAALKTLGTGPALATFCGVTARLARRRGDTSHGTAATHLHNCGGNPRRGCLPRGRLRAHPHHRRARHDRPLTSSSWTATPTRPSAWKIAADSPGLVTPVPQAIDNLLPSR